MIIGGLDVGTTGCKLALYDGEQRLLDTYYREYDVQRSGGMHEMDFEAVRGGVMELLGQALARYRVDVLGVTSFGESFALLDGEDRILAPAMLYTDPRGQQECRELAEHLGEQRLTLLTGTQPHSMYSIGKLLWMKRHRSELFARCRRILLGQDFIVYTLTGRAQIDYSLAARTAAFDVEGKCWAKEVWEAAGIDTDLLSRPVPSGTVAGPLCRRAREQLGVDHEMTVVSGCHDQVAGMIGSGVFRSDQAMDGTGTVECIPVILPERPQDPAFYEGGYTAVPYVDGRYACYAFSFTGGATLKWYRDNFARWEREQAGREGRSVYALLDEQVGEEPTGLLVLPHFAGAATPYMDSEAKAVMVGLTLETRAADIYKALMEGTSYEMLLNFNRIGALTGNIGEIRATGGGAASDVWLQIKADILGIPITALDCREVGAAGTAALAGVAVGAWPSLDGAVARMAPVRRVVRPRERWQQRYRQLYEKYVGLYEAVRRHQP